MTAATDESDSSSVLNDWDLLMMVAVAPGGGGLAKIQTTEKPKASRSYGEARD